MKTETKNSGPFGKRAMSDIVRGRVERVLHDIKDMDSETQRRVRGKLSAACGECEEIIRTIEIKAGTRMPV